MSALREPEVGADLREPTVSTTRMREVLGHFPSGVTVIASTDAEGPVGFACQSFHALSLSPPLVCFCVGRTSTTWPRIRASGRFAVNILGADQEALSRTFATSGVDKFASVEWTPSPLGSPLLPTALAWVDCSLKAVYDGGDHEIVVGSVADLDVRGDDPLIFFQGEYRRLV